MYHTFVARHNIAYFLVYCDLLVTSTSFTRRDAFSHIEFHLLSTFLSVRISKDEVVIYYVLNILPPLDKKVIP